MIGFTTERETLDAVVKQPFVTIITETDLNKVKSFPEANGFINNRNHDYINPSLGIILEDLHNENVLTKNDTLYFIDTVFYTTKAFWAVQKALGLENHPKQLSENYAFELS